VIEKLQPPETVEVLGWRRVGRFGPRGERDEFEVSVQPRLDTDGILGWELHFTLPRRPGHYYMEAAGWWRDVDTVPPTLWSQDAGWAFHLLLN